MKDRVVKGYAIESGGFSSLVAGPQRQCKIHALV